MLTEIIKGDGFTERSILHCDLNNFYASVETVLNPELKGKPVAVCGRSEDRHGIVLAKSECAKHFGVKTGDVVWQAKNKCRELIVLEPHFDEYVKYGKAARRIYYDYTDMIEPFGMDECWLDVTASDKLFGSDREIAYRIKERVKKELGITLSVGVSFNKTFAKLGSDMKKPDGITVIRKGDFRQKVWGLPACDMLWVGRSTYKTLQKYGIFTIGDIANTSVDTLVSLFGKSGTTLWQCANGYEHSEVSDFFSRPEIKSVGRGITLVSDITENEEVYRVILSLSHEVSYELRRHGLSAGAVQISVKNNALKTVQFQKKTDFITQNAREITDLAFSLFLERYDRKLPVRAVSVRAIDLYRYDVAVQLDMFFDIEKHIRREKIEKTVISINEKFGKNTVREATLFCDTKIPEGKTDRILLPKTRMTG